MVFLALFGGVLVVRLLAAILYDRSRIVRALISTAFGVGIGFWVLHLFNNFDKVMSDKIGLMPLLNGLFLLPVMLGVGASAMMVTLGAEGDGTFWSEYFSVGNVSYGTWDVGLGLVGMIFYAAVLAGGFFALIYGFLPIPVTMGIYFVAQGVVLLKTLLSRE